MAQAELDEASKIDLRGFVARSSMSTLTEVLARETRDGELYDTLPDGRLRCYACGLTRIV